MTGGWPLWATLLVNLLAAWRLTRLITKDDFPPIKAGREWILRRWPSEDSIFMEEDVATDDPGVMGEGYLRGTRVRVFLARGGEWMAHTGHWLGALITCPWCAGMYVAAGVVALEAWAPWWPPLALILALSGGIGLIASKLDR